MPAGFDKGGVVCFQCQQPGHYKSSCPMISSSVSLAPKVCYGCDQQGHLIRDCPSQGAGTGSGRRIQGGSSQAQTPQGRVFALAPVDASSEPLVLRGIFPVFGSWARILFDSGVSHSFISLSFSLASGLEIIRLRGLLVVPTVCREDILWEFHTSRFAVHPGGTKVKAEHQRPAGLLQTLPVAQ
ncbi:uncharacterized protein LOC132282055 [Cornus florida]|uniref:uncharacterized protein LOC132282055 n=1 Tax=Cornus florida TaxID=4283 RepID=UPI0028981C65|nr:uncharacterized protein LOC132282055 [Cornus florida]